MPNNTFLVALAAIAYRLALISTPALVEQEQHALATACPRGYRPAVGTLYDSWPKPGSVECDQFSGCQWAGMFAGLSPGGDTPSSCRAGAKFISGGSGTPKKCRWPESLVSEMRMGASTRTSRLQGRQLEVLIQGSAGTGSDSGTTDNKIIVNIGDYCANSDCDGCCKRNTGNYKYPLIDLEKWTAAPLLGYDAKSLRDINEVRYPAAKGMRPGAPESDVMPLCFKIIGNSDIEETIDKAVKKGE